MRLSTIPVIIRRFQTMSMITFTELVELETAYPDQVLADSPTHRVGGKVLDGFEKYSHQYPLYSLQDAFHVRSLKLLTRVFVRKWLIRTYICELKIDGLSISPDL